MEQNVSTFDFPTSTAQDNMAFATGVTTQNGFEMWSGGYHPYTLQDQMEWLSNNNAQFPSSTQLYPTTLQSLPENSADSQVDSQHVSQADTAPTTTYPSQFYSSSVSPNQAATGLAPFDRSSSERPQSAGTMLDSGSTNTSRQTSPSPSPINRAPKFKVPAIRTQFETKGHVTSLDATPLGDGFQVALDNDCMTTMSNDWMQIHDNSDLHSLHDQTLSAISNKTSSTLLEPFQWHQSPSTRRTSVSSAISGPVFSPYGTPGSAVWQQSALTSPYSQQSWTPTSNPSRYSGSPISPYQHRNQQTWNRQQYLAAMRQSRNGKPSAMSLPSRKPRLMRNVTDGCIIGPNATSAQVRARSVDSRARGRGDSISQPTSAVSQQLALPEFQLGSLFTSPDLSQLEFQAGSEVHTPARGVVPSSVNHTPMGPPQITPRTQLASNINTLNFGTPYTCSPAYAQLPTNLPSNSSNANPIPTPAHQPPLPVPSEPPLSDFLNNQNSGTCSSTSPDGHNHNHPPACGPIRQSPHFEGDIYTPRFKRRNAQGKWEGWCGYCQPGRWLDLKNSRYWEDKLRNHGICARTKTFFEGPTRVRWVSDRGTIWEGEAGDSGFDLTGKEGFEDDGVGRKREGLCGECNVWVPMDGMRSRGKGRCVAWWMHAYKCHEQSRARTDGTGTFEQV